MKTSSMKPSTICISGLSLLLAAGGVSCASKVKVSDMQYPPTRAVVPAKRQPLRQPSQVRVQRRAPVVAPVSESGTTGSSSPFGASSSGRSR